MNGKVGVLGGSKEYTGAPFYAALSALRSGADLSHIFTPFSEALIPMKCYSPEIIVHEAKSCKDMVAWLNALQSLVIGPGLGRDDTLGPYLLELL
jgi:ATP-dependent NAD(P)H-hydrate dehydratase